MATALHGTHAQRPQYNFDTFSCPIIMQFCSPLTKALSGGCNYFSDCHYLWSNSFAHSSHYLMQWRVTYFSFISRHMQGIFSLLLRPNRLRNALNFHSDVCLGYHGGKKITTNLLQASLLACSPMCLHSRMLSQTLP